MAPRRSASTRSTTPAATFRRCSCAAPVSRTPSSPTSAHWSGADRVLLLLHQLLQRGPGLPERLYADPQSKGVRCWFAPEDLKIGNRFRDDIDRSIRVYDKLLLVPSERSIRSDWVLTEVETALKKERGQARDLPTDARRPTVLFPVKPDDTTMVTPQARAGISGGHATSAISDTGRTTTPTERRSTGCCATCKRGPQQELHDERGRCGSRYTE